MNYLTFKHRFQNYPLILSKDIVKSAASGQNFRNQLTRWQSKKLIIKLRRGMYLLNKEDRKINPSLLFIANQLYSTSYVSLEFALNFYGLIPERVADVTSVTTRKTMQFRNELGTFSYQHIKPEAFRGFKTAKDESGFTVLIAEQEKAIVDFLYLNINKLSAGSKDVFEMSYRFQNVEKLDLNKLLEFAALFNNSSLIKLAKEFCNFVRKERKK